VQKIDGEEEAEFERERKGSVRMRASAEGGKGK
jgi:hypothetical protein